MPSSQDHKPAFDGDQGPNTGGMGPTPCPRHQRVVHRAVMEQIMLPTVRAMAAEGRPFRGILYAGLMIKDGVPKVLEYNVRFGDPEAQPLLVRLDGDLLPLLEAVIDQRLRDEAFAGIPIPRCACDGGRRLPRRLRQRPTDPGLGRGGSLERVTVFHAGTSRSGTRSWPTEAGFWV